MKAKSLSFTGQAERADARLPGESASHQLRSLKKFHRDSYDLQVTSFQHRAFGREQWQALQERLKVREEVN